VIAGSTDQERSSVLDTVGAWMDLVHEAYPRSDALAWDRPGLQVGDPAWPVSRVLIALDVTRGVLDEAAAVPSTLLLAHHPLLLQPLLALTPGTAAGSLALRAAATGVAVAAAHTNVDAADDGAGTSDPVVLVLGLEGVEVLCPPEHPGARGLGRIGDLPEATSLQALARRIADGLPAPDVRIVGHADRAVQRVAVLGGSGTSAIADALRAGADVLVTGDVRHHVALDALELGLTLIDAGHHATEHAAMPHLRARLEARATTRGLLAPVVLSAVRTDPWEHL